MFTVKSFIEKASLVSEMETMRTWLDHMHVQPAASRYAFIGKRGVSCRVEFEREGDAQAFARAFGGTVEKLAGHLSANVVG